MQISELGKVDAKKAQEEEEQQEEEQHSFYPVLHVFYIFPLKDRGGGTYRAHKNYNFLIFSGFWIGSKWVIMVEMGD